VDYGFQDSQIQIYVIFACGESQRQCQKLTPIYKRRPESKDRLPIKKNKQNKNEKN
jgi:hypothetical protein